MSKAKVEVWDRFVRLSHWGVAIAFATAYITGEDQRSLHLMVGYAATLLIVARIVWGFTGSRHALFRSFVKPPAAIVSYLSSMTRGTETRYIGHNPAGGAMVLALLALVLATGVSGILLTTDAFWGSNTADAVHGALADVALLFVACHLAGVALTSWRTRENLVAAMVTGHKRQSSPEDRD